MAKALEACDTGHVTGAEGTMGTSYCGAAIGLSVVMLV